MHDHDTDNCYKLRRYQEYQQQKGRGRYSTLRRPTMPGRRKRMKPGATRNPVGWRPVYSEGRRCDTPIQRSGHPIYQPQEH